MKAAVFLFSILLGLATNNAWAAKAFEAWPADKSPQVIGHRLSERFLATPHSNFNRPTKPEFITYPEVCTWYGALRFARLTNDAGLNAALVRRFDPIFGDEAKMIPPATNVDFAVFGAVPLELARLTGNKRYLELGLRIAQEQWDKPTSGQLGRLNPESRATAEQAVREGLSWHTRYWIDDMYMITLLQAQAYRASGEVGYIDRAAQEMVSYLDRMQQPNGLFHHAPDVPFFWGRGNGWFAAGMAELLISLPVGHSLRPRVMQGYRAMMASLLHYQAPNGMWRQLIDKLESWPETSGTAMLAFAFITGVKQGWLDEATYAPAARMAWLALTDYVDESSNVREVCEGTNKKNDYQYYLDRKRVTGDLHGQAPVLWCAGALLQ